MVSAIIVTYNQAYCLGEAIDSVLTQTYFQNYPDDWELIIVDDGSIDGTPDLVAGYARRERRIRFIRSGHQGVSRARNLGLKEARGNS